MHRHGCRQRGLGREHIMCRRLLPLRALGCRFVRVDGRASLCQPCKVRMHTQSSSICCEMLLLLLLHEPVLFIRHFSFPSAILFAPRRRRQSSNSILLQRELWGCVSCHAMAAHVSPRRGAAAAHAAKKALDYSSSTINAHDALLTGTCSRWKRTEPGGAHPEHPVCSGYLTEDR